MKPIKLSEIIDDLIANAKKEMDNANRLDNNVEMYWYWRGRFDSYDQIKKSPLEC